MSFKIKGAIRVSQEISIPICLLMRLGRSSAAKKLYEKLAGSLILTRKVRMRYDAPRTGKNSKLSVCDEGVTARRRKLAEAIPAAAKSSMTLSLPISLL